MPFGAQPYNTKREKSSVPLPFRFIRCESVCLRHLSEGNLSPPQRRSRYSVLRNLKNRNALVEAALLADLVRRFERTAVGASAHSRHCQLTDSGAADIASRFRGFSLRYSHVGTSLVVICVDWNIGSGSCLIFVLHGDGTAAAAAFAEVQILSAGRAESFAVRSAQNSRRE